MTQLGALSRSLRIFVAGHRGLVGAAVMRHLSAEGFGNVVGRSSAELDLRNRAQTRAFFRDARPEIVVLAAARDEAAARGGGHPAEVLSDNLRIQVNVLDAAQEFGVERLIFLASADIYPRVTPQPMPESALMAGPPDSACDAYVMAKLAGLVQVQAIRRQYGAAWITAVAAGAYGPGASFDPIAAPVLPGLIRRFSDARVSGAAVVIRGSKTRRREFLHVDDLANAILFLLENYDGDQPINVGAGEDVSIGEVAALVAEVTQYHGEVRWDESAQDGVPRRVLDISAIDRLGWKPRIPLLEGIGATHAWFVGQRLGATA